MTASGFSSTLRRGAFLLSLATCAHPPPAAVQPECTLATPLTPGVPGSPGHLLPSPRNPNGDSELAALMRRFVEDLGATRAALFTPTTSGAGQRPRGALWPVHRAMRCSWPTALADRSPAFDALAVAYLAQVQALDAASPAEAPDAYRRVVMACEGCHQASCPGPLEVIEGLKAPPPG